MADDRGIHSGCRQESRNGLGVKFSTNCFLIRSLRFNHTHPPPPPFGHLLPDEESGWRVMSEPALQPATSAGRRWGRAFNKNCLPEFLHAAFSASKAFIGSQTVKTVPLPCTDAISSLPPCCAAICSMAGMPRPVPKLLVVNSGSRTLPRTSAGMPARCRPPAR